MILGDFLDTRNVIHDWQVPTDDVWKNVLYHLQNADAWDWDLISAVFNII